MGSKNLGEFIVRSEKEGDVLEQRGFESLGLPVDGDKPLSLLEEYGLVEFDRSRSVVSFTPSNPALFQKKAAKLDSPPERVITPGYAFRFKGLDYQLTDTWNSSTGHTPAAYVDLTGRMLAFDTDLRFLTGDDLSLNLEWHDEKHPLVKDIQVGRVRLFPVDGISVSNEPYNRAGSYSADKITLYYPPGTRVDLYQGEVFLRTVTTDKIPYDIPVELIYGGNQFKTVAFLPDGTVKEQTHERDISSFLAAPGTATYYVAAGKEPRTNESKEIARVAYGLRKDLTLEGEYSSFTKGRLTAYYSPVDHLMLAPSLMFRGYELYASWLNGYNASVTYRHTDLLTTLNATAAMQGFLTPVASYLRQDDGKVLAEKSRLQVSTPLLARKGFGFSASPFAEYDTTTLSGGAPDRILAYGLLGNISLPAAIRLTADFRHEDHLTSKTRADRLDATLVKTIPGLGELSVEQIWEHFANEPMRLTSTEGRANIFQWKHAALNLSYTYNHRDGSQQVMVGITGSFTRAGVTRELQSQQGLISLRACIDKNANGKCDQDEEYLPDAEIELNGQTYHAPAVVPLAPYSYYTVRAGEVDGYSPAWKTAQIETNRGQVLDVSIPFAETVSISGVIPEKKGGVEVELINTDTGKVITRQRTVFEGEYYFSFPAYLQRKTEIRVLDSKSLAGR